MKTPLIDSHAHLDSRQFAGDLEAVIQRARGNGISTIISIGCNLESSHANVALANCYPEIFAAVGVHPHDAGQIDERAIEDLTQLAKDPQVVAIGEIGLDYYRDRAPREVQQQAFRRQIRLARELGKPIIVHDRDAHEDVLAILESEKTPGLTGVLHCFSGDREMARRILDLGFYLSFTGTITYPKNQPVRDLLRDLPIESLLIETDCPYLAPQPYRGKRNEPAHVRHTAEALAEIKGLSLADVARITSLNGRKLFGIGALDPESKIAYQIRDSLYLNITNRCTNSCRFCAKFRDFTVKGHHLALPHEPTRDEVIEAIGDPRSYSEVVFCGYGEPLLRLDLVKEIAGWLKQHGVKVRVNTDGQANLVHGRNVIPELIGLIDSVSVSLNAADAASYQSWCQSEFGEAGYAAVKEFLRLAGASLPEVTATAVTLPGLDIEACRRVAEELGVQFRARDYNEVG